MAWQFQSAGTITNITSGTSLSPAVPATYQAGSLFLMVVVCAGSITTAVTGYTNLVNNTSGSNVAIWYKFAGASESAPTVTVNNQGSVGVILAYTGISDYNAISTVATTLLNSNTTFNCTTNTTTTALFNDLVLSIYGVYQGGGGTNIVSYATPSGTTLRANQGAVGGGSPIMGILIADETQQGTGTTTARTSVATKAGGANATSAQFQVTFKSTQTNFFRMF